MNSNLTDVISNSSFVVYHDKYVVVVKNEEYGIYTLRYKSDNEADDIQYVAEMNHIPVIDNPVAIDIFNDETIENDDDSDESDDFDLGLGMIIKNEQDLIDIEKTIKLYCEIKEFEKQRRFEISQLIHPELAQFWEWKFFKITEKYNIPNEINYQTDKDSILNYLNEEILCFSKKYNMFLSKEESKTTRFYLNFPYVGKDDSLFRTRLQIEVTETKIVLTVEPHVTKKGLRFNLCDYKVAIEIIDVLCAEDLEALNQSINKIIDKAWLSYNNKKTALDMIELLLKQKKIDCKLFPEALSVVIEFFVPIINKTISQRIYYREFNDNPNVLHEIEKYAKS